MMATANGARDGPAGRRRGYGEDSGAGDGQDLPADTDGRDGGGLCGAGLRGYYLANPTQVYAITLPMPVGLQVVLGCVWPLLVALFYLPVYQCTELGYFDTAKHTSGVGEGAAPKDPGSFDSGWGGF